MVTSSEETYLARIIDAALEEDLGAAGDITSNALFSADETATAVIRSKAEGVLSGVGLIEPLFLRCDPRCAVELHGDNGALLSAGTEICSVHGPVCAILAAERTILNLLQRLSGIATLTAQYVAAIGPRKARLLDTRKTTPLLRVLEKQAVLHGGGFNHRFGLFDMMLIKDTHVKRCGGPAEALRRALNARGERRTPLIEVEVQTVEEFRAVIELGPDRIMLDNMDPDDLRTCVAVRNTCAGAPPELEASGNITIENIAAVAHTGVDYISSGALTHSAPALDLHLVIT